MCGLEVGSGPPTTTGLLRERQSSISRSVSACCGNIPPVKTRSAQAKSSSVIDAVLQSTRRTVQLPGNIAATVIRDRKSTRLNSSHANISHAVFCLAKKTFRPTQSLVHSDQVLAVDFDGLCLADPALDVG